LNLSGSRGLIGQRHEVIKKTMFEQHDFPHAKGDIFYSPFKAISFAKEHGFPLVVKPNVSGYSRG